MTRAGALLDAMDGFKRAATDTPTHVSIAPLPPPETPHERYGCTHLIVASAVSAAGSFALAVAWLG